MASAFPDPPASLPPDCAKALRYAGLLLLKPDCLRRGDPLAVVEELERAHAIVALDLLVVRGTPQLFDRLYGERTALFGDGLALHHRIFTSGPSAALIVRGEPGTCDDVCARLDALKGPSAAPAACSPRALRALAGRASSFHSAVHAADSPPQFVREATLLFGRDAVVRALRRTAHRAATGDGIRESLRRETARACDADGPANVFQAVVGVVSALIAGLERCVCGEEIETLRASAAGVAATLATSDYRGQRDATIALARTAQPALARLLERCAGVEDVAQRITAMGRLLGARSYRRADVWRALETSGIALSSFDRTLIEAALLADTDPDASWAGERLYPLD